jgi:2'-5' RNA ligase
LETIRAFISLNLDSETKRIFAGVQQNVRRALKDYRLRWEDPDKFHMTLRFLGDIKRHESGLLLNKLSALETGFKEIEFRTQGIGFFPDSKYPNVVYVNLKEEDGHSEKLVGLIDEVISELQIKPDKKFVPHITLGRFSHENRQKLSGDIEVAVPETRVVFKSFYFMKSSLKQSGSEHEEILKVDFK